MTLLETPAGRRWFFAVLYATEGAPMGFIWWALPTLLARQGVAVEAITTMTAAATLPWVLKFLAGPVVDASLLRGARLRTWILTSQSAMVVSLAAVAWIDWPNELTLLTVLLVAHAVCAATQDVAIDTLAIRVVPPEELGRINGAMQAGMLTGRAVVAAGTVALASQLGPAAPIIAVSAVVALPMWLVARATPDLPVPAAPIPGIRKWLQALSGRDALLGIGIALTAGAGFEFLSVVIGPLLVQYGASDGQVSVFFGLLAPASLVAGALVSGRVTDIVAPIRGTASGIVAIGLLAGTLGAILAAGSAPGPLPLMLMVVLVYAAIGFFTAASYALFMRLARGDLAATRFSVFMAMTNACEAGSGFAGGRLQGVIGYGTTMILLVGVSLVALPLLWRLSVGRGETSAEEGRAR
ncbi:MAG: MFS transporter [Gammaproteobacteria bacterium]|nr:MFS transporter [Gammaproteobacteria bacterium]